MTLRHKCKCLLFATTAVGALCLAAQAQTGAPSDDQDSDVETVIVTSDREATQSAVSMNNVQAQKIIAGVSPLKAIETLPGVVFETADPWGNNEQNESLVVHGFTTQQLGYTMDGVPLGDQQYGNYNGLSPTRAISSENIRRVTLESGTGSLGVASTSNLGGAIETYSSDPLQDFTLDGRETLGSYDATRSFVRVDSGDLGGGNAFYISYLHQDQRAWDFDAHQRGDQVNLKYVHEDDTGRFTFFADWNAKVEPNEDAINYGNQQTAGVNYYPYTRSLYYPNLTAALASLTNGTPPASQGNNFTDYHSAAQREDVLTYAKYDWHLSSAVTWSNQLYFHDDAGRGIVAGPINQAGLPGLFEIYYPQLVVGGSTSSAATLTNIANQFGGTGYEVRTTEYRINRFGELSTLNWQLGDHTIEVGAWFERNASSTGRRWYPFSAANDDLTPYTTPRDPNFTQYDVSFRTDDIQLHAQDQWHILPDLTLQAGVKSSLQTAGNNVLTQQQNLQASNAYGLPATSPQVNFPVGSITSNEWLLPQVGAIWNATDNDQVFVNIQENVRQFIPYAAGSNFYGTSPWSLGSQLAFNTFQQTAHPERSWTYEVGVRGSHEVDLGPITAIDGQANLYHVDFYNRLFNVATFNFINPNPAILVNVGGVTDNGLDIAGTLHFGDHFEVYDALSWNQSQYDDNYSTVSGGVSSVVAIAGKQVPIVPNWLNRFILSTNWDGFDAQASGDFIGRRYATYLDDWRVGSSFITGLEAGYGFNVGDGDWVKKIKISGNITNLANVKGISTITVTGASGGFQGYPIPPRMFFVTLGASL